MEDDVRQLVVGEPLHELERRLATGAVHPHVDRPLAAEAHSARRLVELRRAHAEVRAEAVDLGEPGRRERRDDLAERRLDEGHTIAEASEPLLGGRERDLVTIERDHPGFRMSLEDPFGVTAAPHRRVDVDAGGRRKRVHHRRAHHGLVDEGRHVSLLSGLFAPHPFCGRFSRKSREGELRLTAHRPSSARRAPICSRSSSVASK